MPPNDVAGNYPVVRPAIPNPRVGYPRLTAPFATFPGYCYPVLVRLACLIHAANVRSEPGSNPSKMVACQPEPKLGRVNDPNGLMSPKGETQSSVTSTPGTPTNGPGLPSRGMCFAFGDTHPRIGSNRATELSKINRTTTLESGRRPRIHQLWSWTRSQMRVPVL